MVRDRDFGRNRRTAETRWYADEHRGQCGSIMSSVVRHIRTRTNYRYAQHMYHARLFAAADHGDGVYMGPRGLFGYEPSTSPRNVCRMAIDTEVADVAQHRPMPQVLTDHGDWTAQKRARKMRQYLDGSFEESEIWDTVSLQIVQDFGIYGTAITREKIYGDTSRTERVLPWEFLVDDWDARYGRPSNVYHVTAMDLEEAISEFCDNADKYYDEDGNLVEPDDEERERRYQLLITHAENAPSAEWDWQGNADSTVDRIRIAEGWHLCANRRAHMQNPVPKHECTGRYCLTVLDASEAILIQPFDWPRFPFAPCARQKPSAGLFGMGLCELLEGWQYEINDQHEKVARAHKLMGGGIVLNSNESTLIDSDFTNEIGAVLTYAGMTAPQFITPAPVHQSVYQRERDMPLDALNELGFSQQSTQGTAQPGLKSGRAVQEIEDIETGRRMRPGKSYERWAKDVAEIKILSAKEIAKRGGESAVRIRMNDGLLPLKWADVSLDSYVLSVVNTSMFPKSKAAKRDFLDWLFEKGLIDKSQYLAQYGGADAAAEIDLETADRLNIDEKLELLLYADPGPDLDRAIRVATPSPYQNYKWALKRSQQKLNWAEVRGADEANLQALRDFADACNELIDREMAKSAPEPMAPEQAVAAAPAQGAALPPDAGPMPAGLPMGNA